MKLHASREQSQVPSLAVARKLRQVLGVTSTVTSRSTPNISQPHGCRVLQRSFAMAARQAMRLRLVGLDGWIRHAYGVAVPQLQHAAVLLQRGVDLGTKPVGSTRSVQVNCSDGPAIRKKQHAAACIRPEPGHMRKCIQLTGSWHDLVVQVLVQNRQCLSHLHRIRRPAKRQRHSIAEIQAQAQRRLHSSASTSPQRQGLSSWNFFLLMLGGPPCFSPIQTSPR